MMSEDTYVFKKTKRAKKLRVSVRRDGTVSVVVPQYVPLWVARHYVKKYASWIAKMRTTLDKENAFDDSRLSVYTREQYLQYKEEARVLCHKKLTHWSHCMNISYRKVRIKNMHTRWGSCSAKKNLNFNYKLLFLNELQIDYIIVHELAHIKEMNHSSRFWSLVQQEIPAYKEILKTLPKL